METNDIISSGLLELYLLGLTNEQETAQVIALAKVHPEVAAEIQSIESGLETYAKMHAVTPSGNSRQKILSAVTGTPARDYQTNTNGNAEMAKVVSITPAWKYIAAASIVFLIGSAILNVIYYDKYKSVSKDYSAAVFEKNRAQDQLAALEETNKEMKNDMGVVQSKYSQAVSLKGLEKAPDAAAKIFWMKNTGDVYIDASNLPDAPKGMQYQFWGIVDGKAVDGGLIVFNKQGDKFRIHKMKSFAHAEAFAVTLETEGGHPQPQGDMYVMGKL